MKTKKNKTRIYVRIRQRQLAYGRKSLYLDIYRLGLRKYENLGLVLEAGNDLATKQHNKQVMEMAEQRRSKVEAELLAHINDRPRTDNSQRLLLEILDLFAKEKTKSCRGVSGVNKVKQTKAYIVKYRGENTKLGDIDKHYILGFIQFLNQVECTGKSRAIKKSTATQYYRCLKSAFNFAIREGIVDDDPFRFISPYDTKVIKPESEEKVFLTLEELKKCIDTPCEHPEVKNAFLFACFTGLRISDIRTLRWSDISERDGGTYLSIIVKKTRRSLTIKLSQNAMKWMPEHSKNEFVFASKWLNHKVSDLVKKWTKKAGIKKSITFHSSRHTFATMELTLGADLYVISKLLGHANVETTQIYADIINQKRDEAIELLDTVFN